MRVPVLMNYRGACEAASRARRRATRQDSKLRAASAHFAKNSGWRKDAERNLSSDTSAPT